MDKVISRDMLVSALEIYENKMLDSAAEESFVPSKAFDKKMKKLIGSQTSLYGKLTLTKSRKVITVFAAALIVLLSALSVGAIRETILSFFVERGDYRVIEYNTENDTNAPKTLKSLYSPTSIPKGYTLTDKGGDDFHAYRVFSKGELFISLKQFTKSAYKSAFDLKSMDKERFGGIDFVVQTEDDSVVLIWEKDGYVFEMSGFVSKEELLNTACSLEKEGDD